jgi:integrase
MAKFRKPFFRPSRRLWYVEIVRGKQISLGREREAAFARYHELMTTASNSAPRSVAPLTPTGDTMPVVVIIDMFLDWCQKNRAADTYRWYKDRLQLFCNTIPAALTVAELRNFHVQQWIDACTHLSPGSKRNHCRSAQRAMGWAVCQGYINHSPIKTLQKPSAGRRERILTVEEFQKFLKVTKDQSFKDLLTVCWQTGCRPQEVLRVEARHVNQSGARWIFPALEAKGRKLPRIVYLTSEALEITERLMLRFPRGPIFRNTDGLPWTPDAVNCRFQRLAKKTGVRACLYVFRHSWTNRLLLSGVDALTVAILAGHRDPGMIAKHYQHLSVNPDYLLGQARKGLAG